MIKSILACVVLFVSFAAQAGHYASPRQMRANYDECNARSSSWHRRCGQYVVAFNYGQADKICRAQSMPFESYQVLVAGCKADGSWRQAGFYCEEGLGDH